jgi:signal recognition particle receptor subunit alpha
MFTTLTGSRVITASDVSEPLSSLRSELEHANVASDIAASICDSVRSSLVGASIRGYSVKAMIREALEAAIERVLTPAVRIDVLRDCIAKRESRKNVPYKIVFVGINGVGKSTSLAKVAYYLKSHGCSPLIAACDTFRSGAVEQLAVHARCLEVPLHQKGYVKVSKRGAWGGWGRASESEASASASERAKRARAQASERRERKRAKRAREKEVARVRAK